MFFTAFYKKTYKAKKNDDVMPQSSLNGVCFPDINAQTAYAKVYKPQDVTFRDIQNRGFTQSE